MERLLNTIAWPAIALLLLCFVSTTGARIITVDNDAPADSNNIQAAIDDANDGDTVEIQPGTYAGPGNRDIDFKGKAITVRSTDPNDPNTVAATIIDCNGSRSDYHRGFYFHSDEDVNSVVAGLTITNGYASGGGAIYCSDGGPTIRNCLITGNTARYDGGAIHWASGPIIGCIISNNKAGGGGGGLYRCRGLIRDCIIINNSASGSSGCDGGGLYICGTISNCVILHNYADGAGGGLCSCNYSIANCTIAFNSTGYTGGGLNSCRNIVNCIVYFNTKDGAPNGLASCSSVTYSCVQAGTFGSGCINSDPMLAPDGYHLLAGSPCINSGSPEIDYSTQTDIDGEPRVMGSAVDMGPDEFTFEPLVPVGLEVIGRDEVRSGYSAQYLAVASYEDGSKRYVTLAATFWVSPEEYGTIDDNGFLTTVPLDTAQDITVHARHTENATTVEGDFVVRMYVAPHLLSVPDEFKTIQEAVDAAGKGDTIVVQRGTYTGTGNRNIDFKGRAITIRGADPNDPNIVAATIIDCNTSGRAFLFQNNEDANSVLDGLTIINGHGSEDGGAIYCYQSGPTIRKCVFASNRADFLDAGGAIYCDAGSPVIGNCLFTGNSADIGGAAYFRETSSTITNCVFRDNFTLESSGGAIYSNGSTLKVTDCTFQSNSAVDSYGGAISSSAGIHQEASRLILDNCLFTDCSSSAGGALRLATTTATIANCSFVANSALRNWGWGTPVGGVLISSASDINLTNCLLVGNHAMQGGALVLAGREITIGNCTFADNSSDMGNALLSGATSYDSTPSEILVQDSIIWDGPNSIANADGSKILITSTNMPGAPSGYGNIDADPCFVCPGYRIGTPGPYDAGTWVDGDYHLKSQAGRWDTNEGRWTIDEVTSPCIDAADPLSPVGAETFPNGGRLNMGAYGGTREASKSYFGDATCETIVAGDINGDCNVDATDFTILAGHWLADDTCAELPTRPHPHDQAAEIPLIALLNWTGGCGATSFTVHFGTTSPPAYRANQKTTLFDPGILKYSTNYYWRIYQYSAAGGKYGPLWTFKTQFRLDPASNPNPPDGSVGIGISPALSWTAGIGAASHDVYFGIANPPLFQRNQAGTTFYPGTLAKETTHYWRIDEVNADGKTAGPVWSFTTGTGSPPR